MSEVPLFRNKARPAAQEISATTFMSRCVFVCVCVCARAHVRNKAGEVENFRRHLNYVSSRPFCHLYRIRTFFLLRRQ